MAAGLFINFSVAEIEEILSAAKAAVLAGKQVVSYSTGGTSVSKQISMPVRDILDECNYALSILDPDRFNFTDKTVGDFSCL